MKQLLAILLFLVLIASCSAQNNDFPAGDETLAVALHFLGTPYAGGTLEVNTEEQLVADTLAMDCTTFVETALALARTKYRTNPQQDAFLEELQDIRYRNGEIDGYTSRLHYMTDWIRNNESMGIVEDITCRIGGRPFQPSLSYMTAHPQLYPALKNSPDSIEAMRKVEAGINQQTDFCYIPCGEIEHHADSIRNGDILFFTTSIAGLDVQHAGIAYRNGDNPLGFVHASSHAKQVIVDPLSLAQYCNRQKTITGIIVVRPN